MIHLYHTRFDHPFTAAQEARSLPLLSSEHRAKASRFYHWEDRHRSILGKLLIRHALLAAGLPVEAFFDLRLGTNGRPYYPGKLDFNLSHSGNYVVCAASLNCRLGIDIEEDRALDLNDFTSTMTPSQWQQIHQAPAPHTEFLRHWVIKESVIKADGIGLTKALDELELEEGSIHLNGVAWNFQLLDLDTDYPCAIACDQVSMPITLEKLTFQED